jgi:hypothetical protein
MKKEIIIISILCLLISSCKKDSPLSFCEGVSPDENGVKCGTTFTVGDLTALIKLKDPFETAKIILHITEKQKYKEEKINTLTFDVSPDKSSAILNLSFYDEGDYKIKITGKDDKIIAEGEISIVDVY